MATRTPRARTAPKLSEYRKKRDFGATAEPRGGDPVPGGSTRAFVVQKHEARHLHYDLRLEVDGVMKSWAVPKGPSLDPSEKRLAIEVEDHPVEYNAFEGTIPKGEYGGGTVMLWDRGHYTVDGVDPDGDAGAAMRHGMATGKLSVTLHGERLRGSFALVRTKRSNGTKPQWLFFKHEDEYADPARDAAAEWTVSVDSGRSMEEITRGDAARAPRSGRNRSTRPGPPRSASARPASFSPMLATSTPVVPEGGSWTFEPKWDGIRIVALAAPDGVALLTRNGNDKRTQFPEVAGALQEMAHALGEAIVLDGELVGTRDGQIVRFESLQGRMHVADPQSARSLAAEAPAAFVAFDLLLRAEEVLLGEPWTRRRRALEEVLESRETEIIRLGETSADPSAMVRRARAGGWEGLIAKRTTSTYSPGTRSKNWLKVKLENRQEFVVGGWTEPRGSRQHLGALLLGHYDAEGRLVYAGHTGTGLSQDALGDMHRRLQRLERKTSPFTPTPETNQTPHWTTPRVVVEVRFNEWTRTGVLRQPVFVGVREDKDPREVVREPTGAAVENADSEPPSAPQPADQGKEGTARASRGGPVVEQLVALERNGGEGTLRVGNQELGVTNLRKVFYPTESLTKGDLLRYYAAMAPHILPHLKDRPLVLKRFPNGIRGKAFYQQSPAETVPDGVRVEVVENDAEEAQRRIVGGDLVTLLYTIQLGAISYDPWHSRIGSLEYADYTILDLDPGPDAAFATVVEVARKVKEELDRAGLHGALKTSGSSGLHIYLPLPARTPLEAARLVAEIIATRVAERHPEIATTERMTKRRPKGTVYVDYLQNILGKTVAGVYGARAKPGATVSTPLQWDELTADLDLRTFTIRTVPERVRELGDLWSPAMKKRNSLKRLMGGGAASARS